MKTPVQKGIQSIGISVGIGILVGIGMTLVFAAGFFLRGFVTMPSAFALASPGENAQYELLNEVQLLLDNYFLREQPDYTTRQYAAIRGVLTALGDRYTFFIEPPVAQSESDALAGTYGGIGVQLSRNEAGEIQIYPFADGPAYAAGVTDGDILVAVNGEAVMNDQQQDVIDQMLRGEVKEGSGVTITVRKANGQLETLFVEFSVINIPSVLWRVLPEADDIGYVQILRFTSRTPDELSEAISSLEQSDISSLVLDLRNNTGGLLQEAVDVANEFLDGKVVVVERSQDRERIFEADAGGIATEFPLVVLVNHTTASASELVAGAIRDHDRGILIGQRTFGKGTVQQIFRLSDQSSIHITSSEWFTPEGTQIDGNGLVPDIEMIPDENGRDVELGEAIRYLQSEIE